jgi:transposase
MCTALCIETELTVQAIRRLIRRESDGRVRQRLTGMLHLRYGKTVPQAAQAIGISEPKLRKWVHRFNTEGVDGLYDQSRSGRPAQLSEEQKQSFKQRIEAGPTEADGVVRFRWQEFQKILANEYGAVYTTPQGVLNVVHSLGISWITPRQIHPKSSEEKKDEFKKRLCRIG